MELGRLTGFKRLKVNVVAAISGQLHNIGLDHLPQNLPRNRNQHVVVFKIGSEAGAVINAVRNGTSSEEAERALRKLNTSDSIKADRRNEAKIAELTEKADELETCSRVSATSSAHNPQIAVDEAPAREGQGPHRARGCGAWTSSCPWESYEPCGCLALSGNFPHFSSPGRFVTVPPRPAKRRLAWPVTRIRAGS